MNCRENLATNGASKIKYKSNLLDKVLYEVMDDLTNEFSREYIDKIPYLNITHVKKVNYGDVYKKLKHNGLSDEIINGFKEHANFNIQPDGGCIILQVIDKDDKIMDWKLLLVSELKVQGTNDIREEAGLGKQAIGNAIERVGKNCSFVRAICLTEKIYPFTVFCSGCDFEEPFVQGKLTALMSGGTSNNYNLHKLEYNVERATYYSKKDEWTYDEMYERLKIMLIDTLKHYEIIS